MIFFLDNSQIFVDLPAYIYVLGLLLMLSGRYLLLSKQSFSFDDRLQQVGESR